MNKEIQFYSDYDGNNLALLEINNASDKTILQLKEIENHIIRLRFEESPKSEKLQVLSEVLAQPHKSVFILQLLRENNQEAWINIEDFKSVWNVEQLFISNRDWGFDSLKGIEYFQNLKELVLVLRYDKNLSLTPLEACHKLEKINLELPLTKKTTSRAIDVAIIKENECERLTNRFTSSNARYGVFGGARAAKYRPRQEDA